jgi:hypothetical protein
VPAANRFNEARNNRRGSSIGAHGKPKVRHNRMTHRRASGYMVAATMNDDIGTEALLIQIAEKIRARARNDKDVFRNIVNAFRVYDHNGDNLLDPGEFAHTLRMFFSIKLSDEQAAELFNYLDSDGSGMIDRKEICSGLLHGRKRTGTDINMHRMPSFQGMQCRRNSDSCYNKEFGVEGKFHIPGYSGYQHAQQHVYGSTFATGSRILLGSESHAEITKAADLPTGPYQNPWEKRGNHCLGEATTFSIGSVGAFSDLGY